MPVAIADGGDTVPLRKDKIRRRIPEKDKEEVGCHACHGLGLRFASEKILYTALTYSTAQHTIYCMWSVLFEERASDLIRRSGTPAMSVWNGIARTRTLAHTKKKDKISIFSSNYSNALARGVHHSNCGSPMR
jgi:hypothetical protein